MAPREEQLIQDFIIGQQRFLPETASISEMVEAQAQHRPDAEAITAPERLPLTYSRLYEHVRYVVNALNAAGVGRNDRVAVVLPNGPEMAVAFLAVAAGATFAPLNPAYRASEFEFYLSDLNAKAVIVQSGIDSPAIGVAQARGIPVFWLSPSSEEGAGLFSLAGQDGRFASTNGHRHEYGFAGASDVALVLHTSGTTSRPKMVPLTHANICASAHHIRASLAIDETDRCLNVMPLFHIHGLIGALLSSVSAGAAVVCSPGFNAAKFFAWIEAFQPTWYTAVPTMHQAVLARAGQNKEIIARYPLRFIRSCSAALPPQLMKNVEEAFHAPVIEAFGMTEASHQVASNPLPPLKRKPGSVGVAAGPDVAIMDEAGNLLQRGETGELVIRGRNVTLGYENNPNANGSAFTRGWFRTGDQGYLDSEGFLFITGRLKEIINRGGEKVSPREVDEVLIEHPAIAQAVTFAAPHATLGEDVFAAVVLREGSSVTETEIRAFASQRLTDSKVPRRVLIINEIPKGPTGKLQRIGLADKLGITSNLEHADSSVSIVAPRDEFEVQLMNIWEKLLKIRPATVKANFFELGGDSLSGVDLILEIEQAFGKSLQPDILLQAPTIEELAGIVRQKSWVAPSASMLSAMKSDGSRTPFFWVHAVGDTILRCRDVAVTLRPDQPFYVLQSRGLDGKQSPHNRLKTMAADYIKEICAIQPDGPYYLSGYSSGGVVAFEIAQQLLAQGKQIALLSLIDTRLLDAQYTPDLKLMNSKLYRFADRFDFHVRNLLMADAKSQLSYVLDGIQQKIARAFNKVRSKIFRDPEPSSARIYRQVRETNLQAIRGYKPQMYPGRITLFMSSEEHVRSSLDSRLAWSKLAADGLEVHLMPGDHLTILRDPHLKVLAERLETCIDRAKVQKTVRQSEQKY